MTPAPVPALRVRRANQEPARPERRYVLYWCTAARRTRCNFALDRAVFHARALGRPLVVFEALRAGYRWASDRHHAFVLGGMHDNAAACAAAGVAYYPYVEPSPGAGRGLLAALAKDACVVVGDDAPVFFLPRMTAAAGRELDVALELVDGNGLLPLRAADHAFPTAYAFRRFLQRELPKHWASASSLWPMEEPLLSAPHAPRLAALVDDAVLARWPPAPPDLLLRADRDALARFPIDHDVRPVSHLRGGSQAAQETLRVFLDRKLARYGAQRSDPDADGQSRLSPWLHFGHLSTHDVVARVYARGGIARDEIGGAAGGVADGSKGGFWGLDADAEAFLDELVTWRELGYNFAAARPEDIDKYESLPSWARASLEKHARDPRPSVYTLAQLERAQTHDALWNAAQRELVDDGAIHNYLRMLWGKKILEWSPSPRAALAAMIELNNKYAVDGRDPSSYSGIFWCLGRYDRPWAPERAIFGVIRYMSSANTAKKWHVKQYLARHGAAPTLL